MDGTTGDLAERVERVARETGFSGVVRVDVGDDTVVERAYGLADRAHGLPMTVHTRIGSASAAKGFTALMIMALVERDVIALDTTARSLLGTDLPLIDDRVTIEHLLAHRSGIGDYLDEADLDDVNGYPMTLPLHQLETTEAYLPMLDGHPQVSVPGERFAYNNGGFVVLALIAERASGRSFHDLVDELVIVPAGLTHTAFLRSDEMPGDAAIGYLHTDGPRSNLLHLPVRGTGDGGISTTAADMRTLWLARDAGRIVRREFVALMSRVHSPDTGTAAGERYGLGCWLPSGGGVEFEGCDAGASFRSTHHPETRTTLTVLSNTSDGAWPIARVLAQG